MRKPVEILRTEGIGIAMLSNGDLRMSMSCNNMLRLFKMLKETAFARKCIRRLGTRQIFRPLVSERGFRKRETYTTSVGGCLFAH